MIIIIVAMCAATLSLFSGFGLGTILTPAFALFFPIHLAIAATAVVHLANNIFKVFLVGRKAHPATVLRFALPAALAALIGASLLGYIAQIPPLMTYSLAGRLYQVTMVKLVVALLLIIFALWEVIPFLARYSFSRRFISLGGFLSGFFGGLSGHQGALRSAFLIRSGLEKDSLIGTMVVSAIVVDVSRLLVYGTSFFGNYDELVASGILPPLVAGVVAAFIGSYFGARLLPKMTIKSVQLIVSVMLILVAVALGLGIV